MRAEKALTELLHLSGHLVWRSDHSSSPERRVTKFAWRLKRKYLLVSRRVVGFRQNLAIELHHAEDVRLRFFPGTIFSFSQVDQTQLCDGEISSVAPEFS